MADNNSTPSSAPGIMQYADFFAPVDPSLETLRSRRINQGSLAASAEAIFEKDQKYPGMFVGDPNPSYQIATSSKPPVKIPEAEMRKARSDIMLKLLEIERTRCLSKKDEEERTEGLAGLLEGDDIFLARIEQGLGKYLNLMFGDYVKPIPSPVPQESVPDVIVFREIWKILNQGVVNPSVWRVRQHQESFNQREGNHRIMIELYAGPAGASKP